MSPDGTKLVYVASGRLYLRKKGELTAMPIPGTEKFRPAEPIISPDGQWDGTQAASVAIDGMAKRDIWVGTVARGALTRVTLSGAAHSPVWTPDGRRVCCQQTGEAFCQNADGRETALSLFRFPGLRSLDSLSPDGSRLVSTATGQGTSEPEIMVATLGAANRDPPAD